MIFSTKGGLRPLRRSVIASTICGGLLVFMLIPSIARAQSCDSACHNTKEGGRVQTTDQTGAPLECCCIEIVDAEGQVVGFESRPIEECNFD